jgi:hypothetical protein
MSHPRAAFYCVSSGMYFIGAVSLVNSLRLLGHAEPIFVLDTGLSDAQRQLLQREATLVPAPGQVTPFLLKTVAPLRHPAEVAVLLDADIIVTRPLGELIARASHGSVLAVEHGHDRFFPEWGELLGLAAARPRPYVSSSLVLMGGAPRERLIRLMHEVQPRIGIERTPYADPAPDLASLTRGFEEAAAEQPFFFADQDALNAILASEVDPGQIEVLDRRAEAIIPFTGLRVIDKATLRCAYADGAEPYAVHHYLPAKPWLQATAPGVYTQLMLRLLHGPDVAIRVPENELPPHLRPGIVAATRRWYHGYLTARLRALRDRLLRSAEPAHR